MSDPNPHESPGVGGRIWELQGFFNVAVSRVESHHGHIMWKTPPHFLVPKMWENPWKSPTFSPWFLEGVSCWFPWTLGFLFFFAIGASLIAAVCGTDKSCLLSRGRTTTRIASVAQWPSFNSPSSFYSLTVAWMNRSSVAQIFRWFFQSFWGWESVIIRKPS